MVETREFHHAGRDGWGILEKHKIRVQMRDNAAEHSVMLGYQMEDIEPCWREAEKVFAKMAEELNRDLELI